MGNRFSRQNEGVEEAEFSGNQYRYPPPSGKNFFADYFYMGRTRFDSPQPEAYLFGENKELNFLNPKPVAFPYPQPLSNEPTKTLRSLVNLRKDSLKLVKSPDKNSYYIEFVFDADVKCAVTIHYMATEDLSSGFAIYTPKDPEMSSPRSHFPKGSGQVYNSSPLHKIKPTQFPDFELNFYPSGLSYIPVVIQIDADEEEHIGHCNITLATLEKMPDGFIIKPIKQKQMVDGLCYLLQEIYGIENKVNMKSEKEDDNDLEETGLECVICMCDMRDTLILPCRHLCLCRACAESLRYQASNCPICRSPFHALLQICAFIKKQSSASNSQENADSGSVCPGYEEIPLVEALNGTIKPDNIPEEAIARMRRRSVTSIRSSGRRGPSRVSSARSQRYVERSLSACSGMSRPGSAAVRQRAQREEATLEPDTVSTPCAAADDVKDITASQDDGQGDISRFLSSEPDEDDAVPELQVHVDVSLPGTPLSSDNSGRSSRSTGSVTATTPTYVRLEEGDGTATATSTTVVATVRS